MHITKVMGWVHLHVRTCRCAHFRISETAGRVALKFGMVRGPLARTFTKVKSGVHLYVRTFRCASFPYLGSGLTDCAEIWCIAREPLARRFTKVWRGV